MKQMLVTLAALMLFVTLAADAQESTAAATGTVAAATSENRDADLKDIRNNVEAIKDALAQLIKDMDNRTQAADRRLKAIEDTLGTDNMSRYGGITRQLEELQRDVDDIERKVDDLERK